MSQASQGQQQDGDGDGEPKVTWVGQQWRMDGYCGRAVHAADVAKPPASPAPPAEGVLPGSRPVAVVRRARRSQGKVVRIGPPRETPAA